MSPNEVLFQAIQEVLPHVFKEEPGPLTMREARPLVKNALRGRNFDEKELDREVYRHIHQSSINVVNPRAAYRGVAKILWNGSGGTFQLLTSTELADIAAGGSPHPNGNDFPTGQPISEGAERIARESLVRDYLANNLERIESGLCLWEAGSRAVEHPIANRSIDILAKDATGCPVVIELKLHRAHDRVIGQALYYRALVSKYHSVSRVRIVLIAKQISKELQMAAQYIEDVCLFQYEDSRIEGEREPSLNLTRVPSSWNVPA